MVPPFPSREGASARAALEGAGIPLFKAEIRRAAAFSRSAYEGVPVRDLRDIRDRVVWQDYEAAGRELHERPRLQQALRRTPTLERKTICGTARHGQALQS